MWEINILSPRSRFIAVRKLFQSLPGSFGLDFETFNAFVVSVEILYYPLLHINPEHFYRESPH